MTFDYFYPEQAEQFVFFRIPKVLFRDQRFKPISTDAKVLMGLCWTGYRFLLKQMDRQ